MNAISRTSKAVDRDHKTEKTFTHVLWAHHSVWLMLVLPGQGHAGVKEDSPYLRRSLSPSGTHSQGDMCSCNCQGYFCRGRCHKAACLPSTHRCLQAASGRQEMQMVKGIIHRPLMLVFTLSLTLPLFSGSVSLYHTRANTPRAIQMLCSYAGECFKKSSQVLGKCTGLSKGSLFLSSSVILLSFLSVLFLFYWKQTSLCLSGWHQMNSLPVCWDYRRMLPCLLISKYIYQEEE